MIQMLLPPCHWRNPEKIQFNIHYGAYYFQKYGCYLPFSGRRYVTLLCSDNCADRTRCCSRTSGSLQWCHNELGDVSNHRCIGCLLDPLCRRRSKKTSKLRVTGLCEGNSPVTGEFPIKGPVTRKMFPFDDVIMFTINSIKYAHDFCRALWYCESSILMGVGDGLPTYPAKKGLNILRWNSDIWFGDSRISRRYGGGFWFLAHCFSQVTWCQSKLRREGSTQKQTENKRNHLGFTDIQLNDITPMGCRVLNWTTLPPSMAFSW